MKIEIATKINVIKIALPILKNKALLLKKSENKSGSFCAQKIDGMENKEIKNNTAMNKPISNKYCELNLSTKIIFQAKKQKLG